MTDYDETPEKRPDAPEHGFQDDPSRESVSIESHLVSKETLPVLENSEVGVGLSNASESVPDNADGAETDEISVDYHTASVDNQQERAGFGWGRLLIELLLVVVLAFGAYVRFVDLNWDEYTHLHPDERFLTMVLSSIEWVDGPAEYFNTAESSLNPHNRGHGFFVYGTVPIFIMRWTAEQIDTIKLDWPQSQNSVVQRLGETLTGTADSPGALWYFGTGYDSVHLLGRVLNASFDVIAIFIVYLIGLHLYDRRVGLLAAFFSAATVAYIQQAHFATVDTMANFFVVLAIYFAVRAWETDFGKDIQRATLRFGIFSALFGVAFGLAVASRINVAPLAIVIVLAGFVIAHKHGFDFTISRNVFIGLAIAGIVSILTFRVGQPYAFDGLGFAEQWQQNMATIQSQVGGNVDFPPNHQWTDRPAYIFPLRNMIGYGMGYALGITVWLGVAWALWRAVRHDDWYAHIMPLGWSLLYFAWQGQQWVKPIRYFLPIYPTLILLGSAMLIWLWDYARAREQRRALWASLAAGAIAVAVVGAGLWGYAFSNVYTQEMTRVAASRWLFENAEPPFRVVIQRDDGSTYVQPVSFSGGMQLSDGVYMPAAFNARETGVVTEVRVGYLNDLDGDEAAETLNVGLDRDVNAREFSSQGSYTAPLPADARDTHPSITLNNPYPVNEGEVYQIIAWAEGGAVSLSGARLINESSWDDGLPVRFDGYDPFGGMYEGLNLELYWDDNVEKRDRMAEILEQGDYIVISSNRQYDSIPRLPTRYPMTIAYYDALFGGELGYDLVAEFETPPRIGDWIMSDQDAEEPFTVYDHPLVLIYKKSADYDHNNTLAILNSVDLAEVVWVNPYQATEAPTALMLPDALWDRLREGGTWAATFDIDGLLNRVQWLAVVAWLALAGLIGVVFFPITARVLPGLPGRGYALSRLLGLLLIAWTSWILASLQILPHTRWTIWLVFGVWTVLAALVAWRDRASLRDWFRDNRSYVLIVEALTLGLFVLFLYIRWQNPDLWHPSYGGEKPMDFSYFNAVLKSEFFPPYNPWMAGAFLNYYYFGFVMVGVPTQMLGIMPSIAYNLALPLLFSLTGMGAFAVAYNLVAAGRKQHTAVGSAVLAGVAAMLMAVVLGNLVQINTAVDGLSRVAPEIQTIVPNGPLADAQRAAVGLYRTVVNDAPIPIGTGQWYWNATRMIPVPEGEVQPITEFPFFTFIYADLHAHMMGLPLTLLAMGWAVSIALAARREYDWLHHLAVWGAGGVIIGALATTNTWDLPTYLVLGLVAITYANWQRQERINKDLLVGIVWQAGLLVALQSLFWLPYNEWYSAGYTEVSLWEGSRTAMGAYLGIHGLFLFLALLFLVVETRRWMQTTTLESLGSLPLFFGGVVAVLALTMAAAVALYVVFQIELTLLVLPLIAWTAFLMLWPTQTPERRAMLALFGLGLSLSVAVELVVLEGTIGRMNTVFKFYLQIWMLFSVAAGVALAWFWANLPVFRTVTRSIIIGTLAVLVGLAALYPLTAAPAKMRDRMAQDAPNTLDGNAYMAWAEYADQGQGFSLEYDLDAIRWMQENIAGSPVIVEVNATEYKYGSRYTINTGLPGVVGWNWHTRQHRAAAPSTMVTERVEAIGQFYTTASPDLAVAFLEKYEVEYIVVGVYEKVYYEATGGLAKFAAMADAGVLEMVYENPETRIYRYRPTSLYGS